MERRRYSLTPEERVDDYSPPEMTIEVFSTSALQLTLTKTFISLATQMVEVRQLCPLLSLFSGYYLVSRISHNVCH